MINHVHLLQTQNMLPLHFYPSVIVTICVGLVSLFKLFAWECKFNGRSDSKKMQPVTLKAVVIEIKNVRLKFVRFIYNKVSV